MKTLYESILDDNIEDQYSPEKLSIDRFMRWVDKYIKGHNIYLQKLSYNDKENLINIDGYLKIPRKTTLLPQGLKLGNVKAFETEDVRYFDKGLLPKHVDVFNANYCYERPKSSVDINCTQAVISWTSVVHNINIEDPIYLEKLIPGVIGLSHIKASEIKNININSKYPVAIIWDDWGGDNNESNCKRIMEKNISNQEKKELILKKFPLKDINKYWKDVEIIYYSSRHIISAFNQTSHILCRDKIDHIQNVMNPNEFCLIKNGKEWDVIFSWQTRYN